MAQNAEERLEYSRVPGMPDVECLLADHSARLWRTYHENYAVCSLLRLAGAVTRWTYRGKLHASRAGGLMLMEPGEVHANPASENPAPVRPADFRVLFLSPALVERAAVELDCGSPQPHLKLAHLADPLLFSRFAGLHAVLERPSNLLERESRLASCIRLLLAHCAERPAHAAKRPARAALLRVRDTIRQRYSESVSLAELAAASGLSRYYLVRAFAREFGLPPHAYQIVVQVAKARELLARGVAPLQVAHEAGFADQSHFARHFKRMVGVTPGQYRLAAA
jgi:AraC-like DNA-binding protein